MYQLAGGSSCGVPSGNLGDCTGYGGAHAAESHEGTATTAERHGTLSVFVLWCFTFMVAVGVVLSRDLCCIYYLVPL